MFINVSQSQAQHYKRLYSSSRSKYLYMDANNFISHNHDNDDIRPLRIKCLFELT